ncbi:MULTISPECIES: DUF6551 family protein [unclassified Phyllobacterium]|uniref:DUF6551 family protein n=1 Tax=Phyllobacterium TaxID=28100 RepID=UPI000DDE0B66|nr:MULTISPECIES: DUF6551 family protein [unclassified Phyllobacterium]MBA8900254.1 hypothetical protein [Phyllobacterium sp. P30BS-XVII]UGX86217.1 ParB/RepB/Spo0J family partition protein [Phyllobacterium sp. T1293]
MFQKLDPAQIPAPQTQYSPGPAPILNWISTEKFVVDHTYQREVSRRGRQNVQHIAEHFDWSKFAPVIVAPVEGGMFAIVDGQHRTTAAILRGIEQVPCQVVQADRAQQAAAYAAVNGNVTKTTAQQLFYAKLAAGDADAEALADVCAAAGVEICRRNLILAKMRVGQTQAVGALNRCLRQYGRETLITALQCITETADGNAGFVRATIIEALCEVLSASIWRDAGETLLRAMDGFSFPDAWGEITDGRDQIFPATVRCLFVEKVSRHLAARLSQQAA